MASAGGKDYLLRNIWDYISKTTIHDLMGCKSMKIEFLSCAFEMLKTRLRKDEQFYNLYGLII